MPTGLLSDPGVQALSERVEEQKQRRKMPRDLGTKPSLAVRGVGTERSSMQGKGQPAWCLEQVSKGSEEAPEAQESIYSGTALWHRSES